MEVRKENARAVAAAPGVGRGHSKDQRSHCSACGMVLHHHAIGVCSDCRAWRRIALHVFAAGKALRGVGV